MTLNAHDADPILPPELELIILQMALENDMADAKNLLFVAKRTFDWLIPILYEIVILSRDKRRAWPPLRLPVAKLPQYGRHVCHLFVITTRDNVLDQYLQSCPNIIDFASERTLSDSQIRRLVHLPLYQLNVSFIPKSTIGSPPLISALLSNITHLTVDKYDLTFLPHCPSLTHLVIWSDFMPKLYLLIGLDHGVGPPILPELRYRMINDPRMVHLEYETLENWRMKALGDPRNAWSFAERIVERQLARVRAQGPEEDDPLLTLEEYIHQQTQLDAQAQG
ncbi:hypothetical protein BDN72DRAFT_834151 [Pluteus cervinus]|uniref:Uncharacterized protein n=1 Tax=Pluteus cervinus TaxID=181527 RepID=A0ACD3B669_9AGAR|nr:hypothetical protein BDN72DRAFT_834151 [Pluteus cervinus]